MTVYTCQFDFPEQRGVRLYGFLVCFQSLYLRHVHVLSLNYQINFVKDQQNGITAKLHAECVALEEEILGLGLEVRFSVIKLLFPFPQF